MSNQPPYQNVPLGAPQSGAGYPSYPDPSPQGYAQPGPGYGAPAGYVQPPYPAPGFAAPDPRKGQAIAGFVLGLLSLLLWIIPGIGGYLDLVCAIVGIVLSSLGMKSRTSRGLAIAGLVLSIISLAIAAIVIILAIIAINAITHATVNPYYP